MSPEFENLLTLLYSTDKANRLLGLQLATNYQTEFEAHFGYSLAELSDLIEIAPDLDYSLYLIKTYPLKVAYTYLYVYEPTENQWQGWDKLTQTVSAKTQPTEQDLLVFKESVRGRIKNGWVFIKLLKL